MAEGSVRQAIVLRLAQCAHGVSLVVLCVWTLITLAEARSSVGLEWANHDVANTLYVGRVMAEGKRLYVDILELNPPGIFLFAECIERVAHIARISAFHVYHGCVLLLALYGGWLLQRIVSITRRVETLALVGLAHVVIALGCGLPGDRGFLHSFGQREHLFALVFVPYLIWRLSGVCRDWTGYLVLVLLGCGASMKPHFVLLVAVVELIWRADTPPLRRRYWGTLAFSTLLPYALLVVHSSASFRALLTDTVTYHAGGTYAAFNQSYSTYLRSPQHPWILVYSAALAYFLWPLWAGNALTKRDKICVGVLPILSYLLVVQQRKFWEYHSIVVASLLLVFAAYLASMLLRRLPRERRLSMLGMLSATMLGAVWSTFSVRKDLLSDWSSDSGEMATILKLAPQLENAKNVLYYSTSIHHMRLAYSLEQRIVGNKCHDFDYPVIVRDRDPSRRARRLLAWCQQQRELISNTRPDAIVFLDTGQGLEGKEQAQHDVLVGQCHVLPEQLYSRVTLSEPPDAYLYRRRKP